jgi:hypothetical protein
MGHGALGIALFLKKLSVDSIATESLQFKILQLLFINLPKLQYSLLSA